ncbi:conserved membrane hypothetical protein [Candidatus Methylobacter favarea]|uniref:Uncharacterized protein n=1 Tax=Candidatus Methylobacter favarea TaxID=2707345 RepID=A0A8S0WNT2_9GAMM|nr:hypothetical protein [Candidatus Methylobacter favarea]CAA9890565.1 conserved membrane hypothetical protein [Candidatus Methylobacter favarea]
MKMLVSTFIIGIVLLYFLNIALLKTPILDLDWSIHASIRFLSGFIILGVSCFYAGAVTFRKALYITACIITIDYIYDYYTQEYRFKLEIILHGIFMIIWGAFLGYLTAKYIKAQSVRS